MSVARLVWIVALLATAALAGEASERPRIGLVLAGGGAKGAAHVGVIEVLDEMRIPIDCIAGTSMGALVGGTFATGATAVEIDTAVRMIDWSRTVGGAGLRDIAPIDRKLNGAMYSNNLEVGIGADGLRTPDALIPTQEIEEVIRHLISDARYVRDFDDLPIPFAAVATDMIGGNMVVLDEGDLSVAMRASMAIPGVFSPVEMNNMTLADGGLVRNLPIDVARDLCADVVIAVWLESPPVQTAALQSPVSLMARSLDLMMVANEREQLSTLGPDDTEIAIPVGDLGTGDFDRAPEAIAMGRAAAREAAADLARYTLSESEYAAWRRGAGRAQNDEGTLAEVRISGNERVNEAYIRSRLSELSPGQPIRSEAISSDVRRIFASGYFEHVDYRLSGPASARVLEIRTREKPWGPNILRFDFGLATHGDEDLQALLRVEHATSWVNRYGAEWRNLFQVGQDSQVKTSFYQPLDIRRRFFVEPAFSFRNRLENLYSEGDRIARYRFRETYGRLDGGINIGSRAQVRLGFEGGRYSTERDTGIDAFPEIDGDPDASVYLRLDYDTRDRVDLPTRGTYMNAIYRDSQSWFGSDLDYTLVEGVIQRAFDLNGNSLSLILGGGDTLNGTAPATRIFRLGGLRTFPGLRLWELRGDAYWFAGTSFLWRIAELQPVFGQAVYGGVRLSAGEMRDRVDGAPDETLYGVAGSLTGRTPVGPLLLSLGYVSDNSLRFQFSLGRPVAEGSVLDAIY